MSPRLLLSVSAVERRRMKRVALPFLVEGDDQTQEFPNSMKIARREEDEREKKSRERRGDGCNEEEG